MYRRMAPGAPYPNIAWPLSHYGSLISKDRPREAIPLLEEAWEIRSRTLPRGAYWRIVAGVNLGTAYAIDEQFAKAERVLLEQHETLLETYGANSVYGQSSCRRMVALYGKMGRAEEASKYAAQLLKKNDDK